MKPQPPKACSMFHVPSCLFLEGVPFPLIFSSCCFHFSVLFLSSSFHVLLIVLSLSCHCPFVSLSSSSLVLSFSSYLNSRFQLSTEVKPQPPKACSMFHVPSCLFLERVQFPFIFSSCCFNFSVLFLSSSFQVLLIVLSLPCHCPFVSLSSSSLVLSFSSHFNSRFQLKH